MYIDLHVKYPLILLDFNESWIFLDKISKGDQISNFMKICLMGAKLLRVD